MLEVLNSITYWLLKVRLTECISSQPLFIIIIVILITFILIIRVSTSIRTTCLSDFTSPPTVLYYLYQLLGLKSCFRFVCLFSSTINRRVMMTKKKVRQFQRYNNRPPDLSLLLSYSSFLLHLCLYLIKLNEQFS